MLWYKRLQINLSAARQTAALPPPPQHSKSSALPTVLLPLSCAHISLFRAISLAESSPSTQCTTCAQWTVIAQSTSSVCTAKPIYLMGCCYVEPHLRPSRTTKSACSDAPFRTSFICTTLVALCAIVFFLSPSPFPSPSPFGL